MKKTLLCLLSAILVSLLGVAFAACGDTKEEINVVYVPTAQEFVEARKAAVEENEVGYDFNLTFSANVNISTYSGTAKAIYDGKYRYNKTTGKTKFYRATSGLLLFDASEYLFTEGDTDISVKLNKNGDIKKVYAAPSADKELSLINLPFVGIIDGLKVENLTDIKLSEDSFYSYSAKVKLSSDNALIQSVISALEKQDTNLKIKNVSFVNPTNGIEILFNLKNNTVKDFKFSFDVSFPVKAVNLSLNLTYEQKGSSSSISVPSLTGITTNSSDIQTAVNKINSDIFAVKNEQTYSLDLTAVNQFDPGWNVIATTDKYTARLYKHTYTKGGSDFTAFNHSYEYKTHHEEDGAEKYKYTIGNIQDGSTHVVSRKGNNTVNPIEDVSADSQFDYLVNSSIISATDVDCMKTEIKGDKKIYSFSINKPAAVSLQDKTNAYINSNTANGVIQVDNFFNNEENSIKESVITVVYENDILISINCDTEIKYFPVSGEYTDSKITLSDSVSLLINAKYSAAASYEAPSTTGNMVGLSSAGKYIL